MSVRVFVFQARALDGLSNESGALAYVVRKGTSTPVVAYTDSALTIPATNPQVANALGLVGPLYWDDSVEAEVTFRVKTNDAATVLLQVDYAGGAFSASYIQIGQLTKFNATYTADGAQTKTITGQVVSSPYGLNVYFDGIIQPKDNYTVTTNGTDSTITWATNCQPESGVTVYYEAAVLQALSPNVTDYAGVDLGDATFDGGDASGMVVTPTGGSEGVLSAILGKVPNVVTPANLSIVSGVAAPTKTSLVLQAESGTFDTVTSVDASAFPDGSSGEFEIDAGDEIVFQQGSNLKTETGYDQTAQAGDRLKWLRDGSTVYINRILTRDPDLHSSLFGVKSGIDNHDRIESLLTAGMETGKRVVFEAPGTLGQTYQLSALDMVLSGHLSMFMHPGATLAYYTEEADELIQLTGASNDYDVTLEGGTLDSSGGLFIWNDASNTPLGVTRARRLNVRNTFITGGTGNLVYIQKSDHSTPPFQITKVANNGSNQPRFTCSQACAAAGGNLATSDTINIWGSSVYTSNPYTITRIDDNTFDITSATYSAETYARGDSGVSYVDVEEANFENIRGRALNDTLIYPSGQGVAGYDEDDDGRICNVTNCWSRHCASFVAAKRELGHLCITGGGAYDSQYPLFMVEAGSPTQPARRMKLNNFLIRRTDFIPITLAGMSGFDIGTGVEIYDWNRRRGAATTASSYTNDGWQGAAIAIKGASDVLITQPKLVQTDTANSADKGIHVANKTINGTAYTAGGVNLQGGVFDNVYTPVVEGSSVNASSYLGYRLKNSPSGVERITCTNSDSVALPAGGRKGTATLTPLLSTVDATTWTINDQTMEWEEIAPGELFIRFKLQVRVATLGSGSGEFRFSGFPRAAITDTGEQNWIEVTQRAASGLTSVPAGTTGIVMNIASGASYCRFYFKQPNVAASVIDQSHLVVGSPIRFEGSGVYKVQRPLVLS